VLLFFFIIIALSGQVAASFWFKVIEVSPVSLAPNSEANFTVTVKGLGSDGAYVGLTFRNLSEGLTIVDRDRLRYVFPAGTTRFNVTVRAGDLPSGTYSMEVGTAAQGSPPGYTLVNVTVKSPQERMTREQSARQTPEAEPELPNESARQEAFPESAGSPAQPAPAAGIGLAALALWLASRSKP